MSAIPSQRHICPAGITPGLIREPKSELILTGSAFIGEEHYGTSVPDEKTRWGCESKTEGVRHNGDPSGIRPPDTLYKQVLFQLS